MQPAQSRPTLLPLTPAHLLGVASFKASILLVIFASPWVAVLPLGLLVTLLLVAPFFPSWRLFGPHLSRAPRAADPPAVTLTFDDGPDPRVTPALLDLLARRGVRAMFFMVGQKAQAHPELVRRVLAEGHEVGNHSWSHDPLLMLRSRARLADEVARAQGTLEELGARPRCFRPPVGIVNPRLWPVLLDQGLLAVGFSRRAADFGNRRVEGLAGRLLARTRAGDVLLLHDGAPGDGAGFDLRAWLGQVTAALDGLQARGLTPVPLSRLLGRQVMEHPEAGEPAPGDARALFYDGLAPGYDAEQRARGAAAVRGAERALVARWLGAYTTPPPARALELGAGTGRFTLELARRAGQVTALDISAGMLARLGEKAAAAGLDNIALLRGDAAVVPLDRDDPDAAGYGLICAFSCLEYVPRPGPLLRRLAAHLRPGGRLLLTTAHSGPLRLFVQLGNAMRQGIWLHGRTRGQLRRLLQQAGLELEELQTHALRLPLLGGMLLGAVARKPAGGALHQPR